MNFLSKSRIAAVSADVQASLNEIKELLENEDEQQIEYEAIIGKKKNSKKNTDLNILPTTSSNYYFLFFSH